MAKVTIYHNPRCTKSRQTLALLKEHGIEPHVIEYLAHPPDEKTLTAIIKMLGVEAKDLVRRKEFKELGLAETDSPQQLVKLMIAHPQVIERPIVVSGKRAALGRPPENVLEILWPAS
jgi:arsenate reductase